MGIQVLLTRQLAFAALVVAILCSSCAIRQRAARDYGIPTCPAGAERNLLSADALQCWFDASHGRWRLLGHQSHLQALVVEAEARDVRDAESIARLIVAAHAPGGFSEILVYVREEPRDGESRMRRVRWTERTAYETLDFSSPDIDTPLTIRSKS